MKILQQRHDVLAIRLWRMHMFFVNQEGKLSDEDKKTRDDLYEQYLEHSRKSRIFKSPSFLMVVR